MPTAPIGSLIDLGERNGRDSHQQTATRGPVNGVRFFGGSPPADLNIRQNLRDMRQDLRAKQSMLKRSGIEDIV